MAKEHTYRINPLPGIKACIDYMKNPKNKPSLKSKKDSDSSYKKSKY
tara:strand:- start:443 stop:583 length:141 start_codon:yes stop_codon:yes gene_type:complete